jgi:hypothetical protein
MRTLLAVGVCVCATALIGCGDTAPVVVAEGVGVSGEAAAELCQTYCTECGGTLFSPNAERPDLCPGRCRSELADGCGERVEANLYCEMGIGVLPVGGQAPECRDRPAVEWFCSEYRVGWFDCLSELGAACEVLGPDAPCGLGTALGDACIPIGNPSYISEEDCQEHVTACLKAGGDCDADFVVEMCRWVVRAGSTECSLEECISLSRQARDVDNIQIPVFSNLCPAHDG